MIINIIIVILIIFLNSLGENYRFICLFLEDLELFLKKFYKKKLKMLVIPINPTINCLSKNVVHCHL